MYRPALIEFALLIVFVGCFFSCSSRIARDNPPASGRSNLTGLVTMSKDGSPAAGVTMLLCRDAMPVAGCTGQIGETTTGTDGRFWFRNISPGDYVPAVRMSDTSIFVLQKKGKGEVMPKAVHYTVSSDQTLDIEPIALEELPVETTANRPKLIYPAGSESITDRHPTLKWEAVPGAEYYSVALMKVDTDPELEIKLTEHPFEPVRATTFAVPADLDDGMYRWIVFVSMKNRDATLNSSSVRGYFTVAGDANAK